MTKKEYDRLNKTALSFFNVVNSISNEADIEITATLRLYRTNKISAEQKDSIIDKWGQILDLQIKKKMGW